MVLKLQTNVRATPPESLGKRLWRSLKYYSLIVFLIFIWAGSSLFIAPVVQWGLNQASTFVEHSAGVTHKVALLDLRLNLPCETLETLPAGCDGTEDPGEVRYGASSIFYFWGRMPDLAGLTYRERDQGRFGTLEGTGIFYTLQKGFGQLPVNEEALALARREMASYGGTAERTLPNGTIVIEATDGSTTRHENFYAVYRRDDGMQIAAACFGKTCKVPQAPWRREFAYGLAINSENVEQLADVDNAVRKRLDGFVVEQ